MKEQEKDLARVEATGDPIDSPTAEENTLPPTTVTPTINFGVLSPQQRDVIDQIGCNIDIGHHPRTLDSLERMGLIESFNEVLGGRFPIRVKRYEMPLWVHIQWCEWCSREVTGQQP